MAIGDDAAAAGMAIVAGSVAANTIDTEINRSRDYIAQRTNTITPVSKGGTGATTTSAARANLNITASNVPTSTSNVQTDLNYVSGLAGSANANANTRMPFAGGVFSGDIWIPGSSAATSGWTVAYINGDGRVCRGASSERYKKYIHDAPDLGDLFAAPLREYQMRADGHMPDDGQKHIGYIAEELVGTAAERFVVYVNDQVESIDFIALLMAQVSQLAARVAELEAAT